MICYHGSKFRFNEIQNKQAQVKEGLIVPEDELLNAIYLTPDYGFAVVMAARPEGLTVIDEQERLVTFGSPEKFNPESKIYIYVVDISSIPEKNVKKVDEYQIAIVGLDFVKPENVIELTAREIFKYYEIPNVLKDGCEGEFYPKITESRTESRR